MLPTSFLWTRRRTTATALNAPPKLTPLALQDCSSTNFANGIKSAYSNGPTTASSSPFLYTPTEMAGILLNNSHQENPLNKIQLSKEEFGNGIPLQNLDNMFIKRSSASDSNLFNFSTNTATTQFATTVVEMTNLNYLNNRTEFDIEIDMATLATEVALNTLESEDEDVQELKYMFGVTVSSTKKKIFQPPRSRLLPYSSLIDEGIPSQKQSELSIVEEFSIPMQVDNHTVAAGGGGEEVKPIRKGRARMSQEKRRRLARRREREAILLGLPPRASSAPAHQITFASVLENGIGGGGGVIERSVSEGFKSKKQFNGGIADEKKPFIKLNNNNKHFLPPHPYRNTPHWQQHQPKQHQRTEKPQLQNYLIPEQVLNGSRGGDTICYGTTPLIRCASVPCHPSMYENLVLT